MEQLFGFKNEQEYLGMDTADLFADKKEYDRVDKMLYGQDSDQNILDYDTTWVRKDGSFFEGNVRTNIADESRSDNNGGPQCLPGGERNPADTEDHCRFRIKSNCHYKQYSQLFQKERFIFFITESC